MNKKALIFGVSGQDGYYLSHLLKSRNYIVQGISRNSGTNAALQAVVDTWSVWNYSDKDALSKIVDWRTIDEVYFLAGQSSVGYSFKCPAETYISFIVPLILILDCVRQNKKSIRVYNACSSEVFGDTEPEGATESSDMSPVSPYGFAKKATAELISMYRDVYDVFAVNGFLFNHESGRRPDTFLTRKIVLGAKAIKNNEASRIELGTLDAIRDWGWAEDYVLPMHLMLQQADPEDYIIASGDGHSLYELAEKIFHCFNLDFSKYYVVNPEFVRTNDISTSIGNPAKANSKLGWSSKYSFEEIVEKLTLP